MEHLDWEVPRQVEPGQKLPLGKGKRWNGKRLAREGARTGTRRAECPVEVAQFFLASRFVLTEFDGSYIAGALRRKGPSLPD